MKVDMSAKAVTARLKMVSQLRRLCLSLGKAKLIDPSRSGKKSNQSNRSGDDGSSQNQQTLDDFTESRNHGTM